MGVKIVLTCKVFYTPYGAAERVLSRFKDASLYKGLQRERSSVCHHGWNVDMAPMLFQASHECTNAVKAGNASGRVTSSACRCPEHHCGSVLTRPAPCIYAL